MTREHGTGAATRTRRARLMSGVAVAVFSSVFLSLASDASAQSYRFNNVRVEGNQRIEAGTVASYAGIGQGQTVSAGDLNAAYQRIQNSGLFETVDIVPQGGTLVIKVTEFPTVNRINFEGNRRIDDEALSGLINTKQRLVLNPSEVEADAALISEAYAEQGRVSARVTPRVIRRSDNRVDLVFEIFEGGNTEVERISFVGNTVYSDRRLRRVLESKQAGLLRVLFKRDTFVEGRVEFDKQVLQDFYFSRGYVDFRTTGVNAELAQERDGYFVTFNIQEGQQFDFGRITMTSDYDGADPAEFQEVLKIREGVTYSPALVENEIARLERLALRKGLDFLRVEPRITRNERDLTLDVEFVLTRGPRVFVERIDIEGNTTTMDRVIRRQFDSVEGDPFNPRAIREAAERIRALGFFANAEVNAREGSRSDQVVVDVDVEETTTGSLSFGGTYSTTSGFGLAATFKEENFLGRGQRFSFSFSGADSNQVYGITFAEPAFLGRDVAYNFALGYRETESDYANYDTTIINFQNGFTFPLAERSTLSLTYGLESTDISIPSGSSTGALITAEAAQGDLITSYLGYQYSYDSRISGLNPNAGVLLQFGQDFAGLGGDVKYIRTSAKAIAQTKILNEEVTLRATLQGGAVNSLDGSNTRVTDRYLIGNSIMRGFEPDGIGPREITSSSDDALGGNYFAVAQFEAEFPLGLPEEYGITGGLFYDIGSVWGLDQTNSDVIYENSVVRQVVGLSVFWSTPIGPLRFNWSKAIQKEDFDQEQTFDLTIRTDF
ncbi:outer membrane protein assembly factor BamA [Pseudooceanicola aestuarii]|uniref:outer membrane protein assembly factor BamA n=1 Tax=Pseudooceanicola aestuarii TaxID=2697319 RepID=UPI0013D2DBEE|nr:outer membrane protein assembly factor BamA [Pseudooceanicola aestuarii]